MPPSRVYWACQLTGFSLFGAAVAVPYIMKGEPVLPLLVYTSLLAGLGVGETHALRAIARRRRWERLELVRLVPLVLVSAGVMAAVMNLFMFAYGVHVFRTQTWATVPIRWAIVSWLWWFFPVFLGWEAIYFAVQFVRRARRAEIEKWQLKTEAQAAELRFLKAQLNPHFLFNCLNTLRGLIAEDPPRAQTAITQLAKLLRRASNAPTGTIPLSDELDVVRDYLALESLRLEDRLRVTIDVEPASLAAPVPSMLVQGLVENGIKHGIALLPEGGELSITARMSDAVLHLVVTNTTAPRQSEPSPAPAATDGGVGLVNARERLRLQFGERASIELDQSTPGTATARVIIPGVP